MADVTIYDAASGRLLRTYSGPLPELQAGAGEAVYPALLDLQRQCIDLATGEPAEYVPPRPEPGAKWDAQAWRWETRADRNAPRLRDIAQAESRQHRALREAVLTGDKPRLQEIEAEIAALRAKLEN